MALQHGELWQIAARFARRAGRQLIWLFVALAAIATPAVAQVDQGIISNIEVQGSQRIEPETSTSPHLGVAGRALRPETSSGWARVERLFPVPKDPD